MVSRRASTRRKAATRSAQQDLVQPHERHQVTEFVRPSLQPDRAPATNPYQTQSRQRVDGGSVRSEIAHIAHGAGGVPLLDEVTEAIAQPKEIRTRDRAPNNEADGGLLRHRY
jgi:hypothetical protein